MNREELLCKWALEEGFDRAGIARLDPSDREAEYRAWVARGDHGAMEYLSRRIEVRLNPSSRLEGSRSALCVALHYPDRSGKENDLWQGVARYAQGDDYHDVMMRRLRRLGDRIESAFPGCRSRSYVDTGPILERELGQRAGLGSVGKNTMLLHRTGSYFLLGEVLLTLDLDPSETLPDLCGRCTRCLDACPTEALTAPYKLDARRCISYWTIEHRGEFPVGIAGNLSGWTFGCDICQEVCPWNQTRNPRLQPPSAAEALLLPDHRGVLDLVGLASVDRPEYTERFRRSPMKRAKLDGLQRNAVAALATKIEEVLHARSEPCENPEPIADSDGIVSPQKHREHRGHRVDRDHGATRWSDEISKDEPLDQVGAALEGLLAALHTEGTTTRRAVVQALTQLTPTVVASDDVGLTRSQTDELEKWAESLPGEMDTETIVSDATGWIEMLLTALIDRERW